MTPMARTKAARRRLRRQQAAQSATQGQATSQATDTTEKPDNAPTPEQRRQGSYVRNKPQGAKAELWLNTTPDCIAALHTTGRIDDSQEQAARDYEALWRAWSAELGVSEGRSCLDMTPVGHDDGEGDAQIAGLMRKADAAMGRAGAQEVYQVVIRGRWPRDVVLLRRALDALGA